MSGILQWLASQIHLPSSPYPLLLSTALALLITSEATSIHLGSAIFKICASLSFLAGGVDLAQNQLGQGNTVGLSNLLQKAPQLWKDNLSARYPLSIVLGLAFSLLGDAFLIPSSAIYYRTTRKAAVKSKGKSKDKDSIVTHEAATIRFKTGTFFFALAHISYIVAFVSSTISKAAVGTPLLDIIQDPDLFRLPRFAVSTIFNAIMVHQLGLLRKLGQRTMIVPDDLRPLVGVYVVIILTMVSVATATDNGYQKIVGAWLFMISDLFVSVDVFSKKTSVPSGRGRVGWRSRSVGWIIYFWAQMILAGSI